MGVPVLILNYEGWKDTLESISSMLPYVDDIRVVDNGSRVDRTADVLALSPRVKVWRWSANFGWAGGYNRALTRLADEGYDYAYLLNNDAVLLPGAVESAELHLRADPSLAAVGSVILDRAGGAVWFDGEYHDDKPLQSLSPATRAVTTINGAGFALNLAAYRAIGPFHEAYFLYHEEADWFWRAGNAGWGLLVDGSSLVLHAREGSDCGGSAAYYRLRNRFLANRRGVVLDGQAAVFWGPFLVGLRAMANADRGKRLIAAEAFIDGLRGRFGQRPPLRSKLETFVGLWLSSVGRLVSIVARLVKQSRTRSRLRIVSGN